MARRTLGCQSLVPARIARDEVYLTQLANYMLAYAASMEVRPVGEPQIEEAPTGPVRLPTGTKMLRATLVVDDFDVEVPAELSQPVEDDPDMLDTTTGSEPDTGNAPSPQRTATEIRQQKTTCGEPGHEYLPKPSCWTCGRNGAFERAARIAEGTADASRPECELTEATIEDGLGRAAYQVRCMHGEWRNLLGPGKTLGRAERWHTAIETGQRPRSGDGPDEEPAELDLGPPTYQDLERDLAQARRNRDHYSGMYERAEEELRDLRSRLKLAERVCQFYGEAPDGGGTPLRDKALRQAWQDWHDEYGDVAPALSGAVLDDLVARFEATTAQAQSPGNAS